MSIFAVLLPLGWAMVSAEGSMDGYQLWGSVFLITAVLLRSGIIPVHCWMTDLFENLSFGTALLFVTPMTGIYAALRLVVPVAPEWALTCVTILSLTTAVYAAAMALVQREARRFFCYLFLSHSSLVLVGLEIATPIGLTGALSLWLSVSLSLAGFGLTLRALEARMGQLSLTDDHGLYEHMPTLAVFFLLTGLASVGYPGTIGFLATELLVDGAVQAYPYIGLAVVLTGALNGIAVVQAYFRLFAGTRCTASVSLRSRPSERVAVLTLALLILGGGLLPQPGIASRYRAAMQLVRLRESSTAPIRQAGERRAGSTESTIIASANRR
jgi:NADH-quinone oxidoreductase subunit M